MKLVNDQVQTHQIRDQVRSQVWNQAQCRGYNPVWAQAWRQIREPINNQLIPLSAQLRIPA